MREEKILVRLLRRLAELVEREADQNPQFADQLDALLAEVPRSKPPVRKQSKFEVFTGQLPDIFVEWKVRGETEFELWLRGFDVPLLRALIKHHGFDASKRSQKWNDPMKLARLISHQLKARLNRGSSFLKPSESS